MSGPRRRGIAIGGADRAYGLAGWLRGTVTESCCSTHALRSRADPSAAERRINFLIGSDPKSARKRATYLADERHRSKRIIEGSFEHRCDGIVPEPRL